jgi:predicted metal-dependent peptidase
MMNKFEDLSIEDRIIAAKVQMLMALPFFGSLASNLHIEVVDWKHEDGSPITAATDGLSFFYNPEGIKNHTCQNLIWLFAHEVSHVCWQHFVRQGDRHTTLWNIAADYAINSILKKNNIGKPIKDHLYDRKFDNMPAEQIYDILYKDAKNIDIDALAKLLADKHLDMNKNKDGSPKSEEEIKSLVNKIKEDLLKAAQNCDAGNVPQGMDRLIEQITNPQLPWYELLKESIKSKIKSDFSFQKPNRRSSTMNGIILPSMKLDDQIDICIAIDASGSIDNNLLSKFMSEIYGIVSDFINWNITIWSFDAKVHNVKSYSSDSDTDILAYKAKGGGGTLFEANWEFMKNNEIVPKLFVVFTDMCPCNGWGDPDYCDTLFVGIDSIKTKAPFGETIYLK